MAVLEDSRPLAPCVERTTVTADLIVLRIPFHWEDELVVVVPPSGEGHVDRLLDDLLGVTDEGVGE